QAAEQLSDRGGKIEVIDSQSVSLGISFLVCAAAKAAVGGAEVEEIKTLVEGMVPRVRIVVVLDTLEYARRGGRIRRARAFLGNMLRIKPILYLRDGQVHPGQRVRGRTHAYARVGALTTAYPRVG